MGTVRRATRAPAGARGGIVSGFGSTRGLAAAFMLGLSLLVSGVAPAGAADGELGERLVRKFFADAQGGDMSAVEATLAEGFQSSHTDGARDRAGELAVIRNVQLGSHRLTDFETTRNGPVLVVTFEVDAPGEVLDGKHVGAGAHERMAVWLEGPTGWQLVAYANLAPLKE